MKRSEGRASARPGRGRTDPKSGTCGSISLRDAAASLRIGAVRYLNARPLVDGWPEIILDHPAVLCEQLANGDLDVALVSSFEFLRNPIYTIVDGVAIASDGPVYSVFLAHRGEFAEIEEVELDPRSATSVNLLRCLFGELNKHARLHSDPRPNESLDSMRAARLLIGDQAIRFRQTHGARYRYWDLGEEWNRLCGLPFVYALWLIRPSVEAADMIAARLRGQRDENIQHLDELIARQTEHASDFCARYFRDYLKFGFGDLEKEGLLHFRSLCQKHGILPPSEMPLKLI